MTSKTMVLLLDTIMANDEEFLYDDHKLEFFMMDHKLKFLYDHKFYIVQDSSYYYTIRETFKLEY